VLPDDDLTANRKEIASADSFKRFFKEIHGCGRREIGSTAAAAEGEKVKFPGLLIANALAFHALRGYSSCEFVEDEK
jgi:hypothetical protein